jgi:hypothetical protein
MPPPVSETANKLYELDRPAGHSDCQTIYMHCQRTPAWNESPITTLCGDPLSLCYLVSSDIPLLHRRQPRLPTVRKFWASEAIVPGGPPRGGPSVCVNCKWRAGNNEIFPARHRLLLALEKPKVAGQIEKIKNGIHAHLEDFNSSVSTSRPRSKIAAPPSPSPNIHFNRPRARNDFES